VLRRERRITVKENDPRELIQQLADAVQTATGNDVRVVNDSLVISLPVDEAWAVEPPVTLEEIAAVWKEVLRRNRTERNASGEGSDARCAPETDLSRALRAQTLANELAKTAGTLGNAALACERAASVLVAELHDSGGGGFPLNNAAEGEAGYLLDQLRGGPNVDSPLNLELFIQDAETLSDLIDLAVVRARIADERRAEREEATGV